MFKYIDIRWWIGEKWQNDWKLNGNSKLNMLWYCDVVMLCHIFGNVFGNVWSMEKKIIVNNDELWL